MIQIIQNSDIHHVYLAWKNKQTSGFMSWTAWVLWFPQGIHYVSRSCPTHCALPNCGHINERSQASWEIFHFRWSPKKRLNKAAPSIPSCQYVISWRRFVKEVILVRQSPILPTSLTVWINQIPQDYLRGIICAGIMGIRRNWANKYAAWDHGTDAGRQRRHLAHNQYVLLR